MAVSLTGDIVNNLIDCENISSENYARLMCLIVEEGTRRMKHYVLNNLPVGATSLEQALASKKSYFKILKNRHRRINKQQFKKLYPGFQLPVIVEEIDLSLWYILVKNLATNPHKVNFHKFENDKGPTDQDVHPAHDVIRLRNMRNALFHLSSPELNTESFEIMWDKIASALKRLGSFEDDINTYKSKQLDKKKVLNNFFNFREQVHGDLETCYKAEVSRKKQYFIVLLVCTVFLTVTVITTSAIIYKKMTPWKSCMHSVKTFYSTQVGWGAILFMPRSGWHADPPRKVQKKLNHSLPNVVISQSELSGLCLSTDECCLEAKVTQEISFHRGFSDIVYNFLVGNDGVIYEGTGWSKEATGVKNRNNITISFGFMGTFGRTEPPEAALDVAQGFLQYLVDIGVVSRNFSLYGLCQLEDIPDSPGKSLFNVIKKWHGQGKNTWSWRPYPGKSYCNDTN